MYDKSTSLFLCTMSRLQSVQNAAARLVSGAQRCDHIMPVLQQLHWLPVRRRVDFKMATLVYMTLSGMAPAYLAVDCHLVSDEGRRRLRFANSRTCRQTDLQQLWRHVLLLQVLGCGTIFRLI